MKRKIRPVKIAQINLGCAKNQVDAEVMAGFLTQAGLRLVDRPERADVIVVNTCAFIREATEEAIETLFAALEIKKQSKQAPKVIAAGCLPQRFRTRIKTLLPEIDGFIGPGSLDRLPAVIAAVLAGERPCSLDGTHFLAAGRTPRRRQSPGHYSYIKIADGCDNRCSYCVIPLIRGPYRSRSIASIVDEAKQMADEGVKEINLISQDTTYYGKDRYAEYALERLLSRLVRVKGLHWIRILYTHPRHFRSSLLDMIRDEQKICKYIDMPVQHISDTILKRMGRRINGQQIRRLIARIRKHAPQLALRTSLITGFPGETREQFAELEAFVQETAFERLGVFAYSQEEQTAAALMTDQLSPAIRRRRRDRLMKLQQGIAARHQLRLVGQELDVLVDERSGAKSGIGRTEYDAPEVDGVVMVSGRDLRPGNVYKVRITDSLVYDLAGEVL